jgi:hypothetical protein
LIALTILDDLASPYRVEGFIAECQECGGNLILPSEIRGAPVIVDGVADLLEELADMGRRGYDVTDATELVTQATDGKRRI